MRAYLRKMFMEMQKDVNRIVAERAAEKAAQVVEESKDLPKKVMLGDLRSGSLKMGGSFKGSNGSFYGS